MNTFEGQLHPCAVCGFMLLACWSLERYLGFSVRSSEETSIDDRLASSADSDRRALIVWGIFLRGIACTFFIAFTSLRPQILALAGKRGLYPAANLVKRLRQEMSLLRRVLHFPAGVFWLSCTDETLLRVCDLGLISSAYAIYGGFLSPIALFMCWAVFVMLCTVLPMLQYPWDCLLMESGFACGCLLPSLRPLHAQTLAISHGPPSSIVALAFRLLILRVMLGMGKSKFAAGWQGDGKSLFLKYYMSWQPLPTSFAWYIFNWLPDGVFQASLYAMYVVEIMMPAMFLCSYSLRKFAAVCTMSLQVCIQLLGNYAIFNLLTAVLTLPLLAPSCSPVGDPSFVTDSVAACLICLGMIQFPHDSYTTNAWPFLASYEDCPAIFHKPANFALCIMRALAPLHITHAYGVFFQEAPKNVTTERRMLRFFASYDYGVSWLPYPTHVYPSGLCQRLRFVAPHQPRLDHLLYYVGFSISLQATMLVNPFYSDYSSPSLLPRLALRLLQGEKNVSRLLGSGEELPTDIKVERVWVRYSTAAERKRSGRIWVETPSPCLSVDIFSVQRPNAACPILVCNLMYVPRLCEMQAKEIGNWWSKLSKTPLLVVDEVSQSSCKIIDYCDGEFTMQHSCIVADQKSLG